MKVIIAIDSFKGCLNSQEANEAARLGVRKVWPDAEVVTVPVSDGGEGFLTAFQAAFDATHIAPVTKGHDHAAAARDGFACTGELSDQRAQNPADWDSGELRKKKSEAQRIVLQVHDPLMRPVRACYLLKGETAVIEMAQASGLNLIGPSERNPLLTSSYGTGELVADAIGRGAKRIIVGLGGSATSDCGKGMLRALADFCDKGHSDQKQPSGYLLPFLGKEVSLVIATDVRNPLCGPQGAARMFAPQKGATPAMVELLEAQAVAFARESAQLLGYDRSQEPGAGAAGGLGYAFMQYLHADCRSGVQLLLDMLNFRRLAQDADLIITGEGSADRQTLMGKLPFGVLQQAGDVPVWLIAGRISHRDELLQAGFACVDCINPPDLPAEAALQKEVACQNIIHFFQQKLGSSSSFA